MRVAVVLLALAVSGCAGRPIGAQYQPQAPTVLAVAPSCSGHENSKPKLARLEEIIPVLKGGNFKKSEFETTAEFEKRLADRVAQAGRFTENGELALFIPIPDNRLHYNADAQTMTVGENYTGILDSEMSFDGDYIVGSRENRRGGGYVGENAFGAKRAVTKIDRYERGLSYKGRNGLAGWPASYQPISFRMDRDAAKTAKKELGVLFIGQLASPYFRKHDRRITPKIDLPYDVAVVADVVHMSVRCAAIYNRVTNTYFGDLKL